MADSGDYFSQLKLLAEKMDNIDRITDRILERLGGTPEKTPKEAKTEEPWKRWYLKLVK